MENKFLALLESALILFIIVGSATVLYFKIDSGDVIEIATLSIALFITMAGLLALKLEGKDEEY